MNSERVTREASHVSTVARLQFKGAEEGLSLLSLLLLLLPNAVNRVLRGTEEDIGLGDARITGLRVGLAQQRREDQHGGAG